MNSILCITLFCLGAPQERERNPLAPSLPLLTKEESAKYDAVIERFIQYDIGKLKGADGKKALDDFNRLGPDSIFNLIDGLNRAANMESSCPAVIIAKKVAKIIVTTEDLELLTFAKENIGAGVTAKRHVGVLKDLQANILLRRGFLQRQAIAKGGAKSVGSMTQSELESAISKGSGGQLSTLLAEVEKRQGAAGLKTMLKHERAPVRIATAQIVAAKKLRFGDELIGLLRDSENDVRQAARKALVQISGGADYGPAPDATLTDREACVERWREWWSKQK